MEVITYPGYAVRSSNHLFGCVKYILTLKPTLISEANTNVDLSIVDNQITYSIELRTHNVCFSIKSGSRLTPKPARSGMSR